MTIDFNIKVKDKETLDGTEYPRVQVAIERDGVEEARYRIRMRPLEDGEYIHIQRVEVDENDNVTKVLDSIGVEHNP